jgi:hypothetical protein
MAMRPRPVDNPDDPQTFVRAAQRLAYAVWIWCAAGLTIGYFSNWHNAWPLLPFAMAAWCLRRFFLARKIAEQLRKRQRGTP